MTTTPLAPGLAQQRLVLPGGQVVHVLRVRPAAGLLDLEPVLVGGSTLSAASLSRYVADRVPSGTLAAINADLFNRTRAYPSGALLLGGQPVSEPEAGRSALVRPAAGPFAVLRLGMTARWQALDGATPAGTPGVVDGLNRYVERPNETVLYTAAVGPVTPPGSGWDATVQLDGGALPLGAAVDGTVLSARAAGGTPVAAGQAVLRGTGTDLAPLRAALTPGRRVRLSVAFTGLPGPTRWVVGGGPLLVRDGVAVADAREAFTQAQSGDRTQRSGFGETADGTLLLVVTEGAEQGSRGMDVAEQASLMASLGARSAIAFDGGGSAQLVTLGRQASARAVERPVSTALAVAYRGAAIAPLLRTRLSPNGDGRDDRIPLSVSVGAPGEVRLVLERRGGGETPLATGRGPGVVHAALDPRRLGVADGPYAVVARMTADDGTVVPEHRRLVILDRTLARVRAAGRAKRAVVRFTLVRPARVRVLLQDAAGRTLRTPVAGGLSRGPHAVAVAVGTGRSRARTVTVQARTSLGATALSASLPSP